MEMRGTPNSFLLTVNILNVHTEEAKEAIVALHFLSTAMAFKVKKCLINSFSRRHVRACARACVDE